MQDYKKYQQLLHRYTTNALLDYTSYNAIWETDCRRKFDRTYTIAIAPVCYISNN